MSKINIKEIVVQHNISQDYFTKVHKEEFLLLDSNFSSILKIKKESMIEIASKILSKEPVSMLLSDGWKNDKREKFCGIAIKIVLNDEYYEFTIYYGVDGEKFDIKQITKKEYYKVTENSFNTICNFVIYNNDITKSKEEFKKLERTTLELE